MQDINPLGPMFHLKELERQAAPRLRQPRVTGFSAPKVTIAGLFAFLGFASIWLV